MRAGGGEETEGEGGGREERGWRVRKEGGEGGGEKKAVKRGDMKGDRKVKVEA